jgi:exodeoxyribonuclease VII small subunit
MPRPLKTQGVPPSNGGNVSDETLAQKTFEQALAELEQIVRDLESGSTGLEQSLARYEAGIVLLKQCYAKLADAEQRIVKLAGLDADGKPTLAPFEHTAAVEQDKPKRERR